MKIGIIPVAAKPYHAGHHFLVTEASKENDLVMLAVSLKDRKRPGELPVLGSDMKKIWVDHIESILPDNVQVNYLSNVAPVRFVYETLINAEDNPENADVYTIYSDSEATKSNYPEKSRLKYFPKLWKNHRVKFRADDGQGIQRGKNSPNISGTQMRKFIKDGDLQGFIENMPSGIDGKEIFSILSRQSQIEGIRRFIKVLLR